MVFDFAARTAATRAHNLQRLVYSILHDAEKDDDDHQEENETKICSIRLYLVASDDWKTPVELTINPATSISRARRLQWHNAWTTLKQRQQAYLASCVSASSQQEGAAKVANCKVKLAVSRYSLADLAILEMQKCWHPGDATTVYSSISSSAVRHNYRVYMTLARYGECQALTVASQQLLANKEFVLAACWNESESDKIKDFIHLVHETLWTDREFVLALSEVVTVSALLCHASAEILSDRELVLRLVSQHGMDLKLAAPAFQSDREVVLAAVQQNGCALRFASTELQSDRDTVNAAVQQNGCALQFASAELQSDRDIVVAAVKGNCEALQFASNELRSDRNCVLAGTSNLDVGGLRYASEELRGNAAFVLEYVAAVQREQAGCELLRRTNFVLPYVTWKLRSNREFVLARVTETPNELQYAPRNLRNDVGVVMAAVQSCGGALAHASEGMQDNIYCALAAARHKNSGFEFASPRMRNTKEVALAAVRVRTLHNVKQLGPDVLQDVDVWRAAIQGNWQVIELAPAAALQCKDIALCAVSQSCQALPWLLDCFNQDVDVWRAAIQGNWQVIELAPAAALQCKDIALCAVSQSCQALPWLLDCFKQDVDVVLASLRAPDVSQHFMVEWIAGSRSTVLDNEQVVFEAASCTREVLKYAAPKFRENYKVVLAVVKKDGAALSLASDALRNNFRIVMSAVSNCGAALQHASASLRGNLQIAQAAVSNDRKAATWVRGKARKEIMKLVRKAQRIQM
jgi:hypothetical protein